MHAAGGAGEGAAWIVGAEIVVEDFLEGEEASFFALVDGETCVALASAQDHKAVGEGDTGAAPVHHVLLTCPPFLPETYRECLTTLTSIKAPCCNMVQ